jgi:hypothetical protein
VSRWGARRAEGTSWCGCRFHECAHSHSAQKKMLSLAVAKISKNRTVRRLSDPAVAASAASASGSAEVTDLFGSAGPAVSADSPMRIHVDLSAGSAVPAPPRLELLFECEPKGLAPCDAFRPEATGVAAHCVVRIASTEPGVMDRARELLRQLRAPSEVMLSATEIEMFRGQAGRFIVLSAAMLHPELPKEAERAVKMAESAISSAKQDTSITVRLVADKSIPDIMASGSAGFTKVSIGASVDLHVSKELLRVAKYAAMFLPMLKGGPMADVLSIVINWLNAMGNASVSFGFANLRDAMLACFPPSVADALWRAMTLVSPIRMNDPIVRIANFAMAGVSDTEKPPLQFLLQDVAALEEVGVHWNGKTILQARARGLESPWREGITGHSSESSPPGNPFAPFLRAVMR